MLWVATFLMIIAEGLIISGEMYAADLGSGRALFLPANFKLYLSVIAGGATLLFAYALGYASTKNIWIISAVSVTSILVIEPVLAWYFFHQLPTKGALLGLVLGATGLLVAIFWR